ncbi:MAG: muramoyltetrapeptide carboxypeptidase [Clostridia bacterium]|nr:muramoyltetrapeptide carboxypeptidase [Clostridia bacterium]
MNILKPPQLKKGDTIGVIYPASPLPDIKYLERGKAFFNKFGFNVIESYFQSKGYLAGSDAKRLANLHQMFEDPNVKALICLRGGYGTLRLLQDINYQLIRSNPKILIGYSDITALHLAINKMTGLVTFHGPMIYPELGEDIISPYTIESLIRTITLNEPLGTLDHGFIKPVTISPGQAEGMIIGGNLSLVTATLGTPFEIDTTGKILFLEEVDEAPYRIDRMLMQLKLAGKLEVAAGIIFGQFTRCINSRNNLTPLDIIKRDLVPLGKPCIYGLPAGHLPTQLTLPLGIRVRLDATNCTLTYLESALKS